MRVEIQNTVTGSATIGMYIQRTVIANHLYADYGVVGISKRMEKTYEKKQGHNTR